MSQLTEVLAPGTQWSVHARNFVLFGDEALDKRTAKAWKRCSYGQSWDTNLRNCSGEGKLLTQAEAQQLVQGQLEGWRLPTAIELLSAIKDACPPFTRPELKPVIFPSLKQRFFLSAEKQTKTNRPLAVSGCFAERPIATGEQETGFLLLVRDFERDSPTSISDEKSNHSLRRTPNGAAGIEP